MKAIDSADPTGSLQVLHDISVTIGMQAGQREKLREVLDHLEAQLEMDEGRVVLLSPDGDDFVVESTGTVSAGSRVTDPGQREEDISARVLRTGQVAIMQNNGTASPTPARRQRGSVLEDSWRRTLCVPIAIDSEIVGTLAVNVFCHDEAGLERVQQVVSIVAGMLAADLSGERSYQHQKTTFEDENIRLRSALGEQFRPENIMGNSHAMKAVYESIRKVAPMDTTVLILGEPGTGKELVASAIHYGSARRGKPFVRVNCGSMSDDMLEGELFGHEAGAVVGGAAHADRPCRAGGGGHATA